MHSSLWQPRALCGLALLLSAGCQTYSPYGYGYPGGSYAPPPGAVMPGQSFPGPPPGATFSSPGAPALGTPAPAPHQGNFMTPTPANPAPGGNAPAWDPTSTGGGASKSDGLVPDYGDPNELPGSPSSFNDSNARPLVKQVNGIEDDSRSLEPAAHEITKPEAIADNGPDAFEAPVELDTAAAEKHSVSSGPDPFDYDHEGYSFLRGIIDFDPEDKTWHIIYNRKPSPDDKFSGAIGLLPDPVTLKSLRNGQVVHVEGAVEYNKLDRNGKPQYRVDHVMPVKAAVLK